MEEIDNKASQNYPATKKQLQFYAEQLAEGLYGEKDKKKSKLRTELEPLIAEIFGTYIPEKPPLHRQV